MSCISVGAHGLHQPVAGPQVIESALGTCGQRILHEISGPERKLHSLCCSSLLQRACNEPTMRARVRQATVRNAYLLVARANNLIVCVYGKRNCRPDCGSTNNCTSFTARNSSRMFLSVNLVPVRALVNRGNVSDSVAFVHVRDFTFLFKESDCIVFHFAITLGKNALHARTGGQVLCNLTLSQARSTTSSISPTLAQEQRIVRDIMSDSRIETQIHCRRRLNHHLLSEPGREVNQSRRL